VAVTKALLVNRLQSVKAKGVKFDLLLLLLLL
jgi:hypothetical protein